MVYVAHYWAVTECRLRRRRQDTMEVQQAITAKFICSAAPRRALELQNSTSVFLREEL